MRLVDMEASYLTVEFFRKLPQEMEKAGNPANQATPNVDRYGEGHYRRIGSNVSSYIGMVSDTLRNTIPKAVVYCQVREAKLSLLNHFYTQIGKKEVLSHSCSRSRLQLKLICFLSLQLKLIFPFWVRKILFFFWNGGVLLESIE